VRLGHPYLLLAAVSSLACNRDVPRTQSSDAAPGAPASATNAPSPPASDAITDALWAPDSLRREFADLSRTPPAVAAALFRLESRLLTRLDSASATDFACDEAAPAQLFFVADGRVLDTLTEGGSAIVRAEITSVARARRVEFQGCDLKAATIVPGITTDTIDVVLERQAAMLPAEHDFLLNHARVGLSGALPATVATADWKALGARADSIRQAHGQPPARPFPAWYGSYDPYDAVHLYPVSEPDAECPATASAPVVANDSGAVGFIPRDVGGAIQYTGPWFAMFETRRSRSGACIKPVMIKSRRVEAAFACGGDPRQSPTPWFYDVDGFSQRPMLLVQNVNGLRTGPARDRFTIVLGLGEHTRTSVGWNRAALVFSSEGEVMRVVEHAYAHGPGARYRLDARYRNQSMPLMEVNGDEMWGVLWAGYLNEDDVPDFVLHTTRRRQQGREHRLTLVTSAPGNAAQPWSLRGLTYVQECR
jgi:hypothetical protein